MLLFRWSLLSLVLLACAPPRQSFDSNPITGSDLSAPVEVSQGPDGAEDPTLLLGRNGRYYAAWSAKQGGRARLLMRSSGDGRILN